MSYWTKTAFWHKVKDTIQVVGTFTQLGLILGDSQHIYNVITAVAQLIGLILPIWLVDMDQDGEIDTFQKEVTVKVTSDAPIQVETKTETKPPSE